MDYASLDISFASRNSARDCNSGEVQTTEILSPDQLGVCRWRLSSAIKVEVALLAQAPNVPLQTVRTVLHVECLGTTAGASARAGGRGAGHLLRPAPPLLLRSDEPLCHGRAREGTAAVLRIRGECSTFEPVLVTTVSKPDVVASCLSSGGWFGCLCSAPIQWIILTAAAKLVTSQKLHPTKT